MSGAAERHRRRLHSWWFLRSFIERYHDSIFAGHLGVSRAVYRLLDRVYWPGLREDLRSYIASCSVCLARKSPCPRRAPMVHVSAMFRAKFPDPVGPPSVFADSPDIPDARTGFDGISVIVVSDLYNNSIPSGESGERQSSSSSVASDNLDGDVGLLMLLLSPPPVGSMTRAYMSSDFSLYSAVNSPTGLPRAESVTPVTPWRLAQEVPFLSKLPRSDVGAFGPGCAFCNTTHKSSDFAQPSGKYGLPLHHPRFL